MDASQIKRLSNSKAYPVNFDSDESVRVTIKKRASTGVLPRRKHQG